MSVESKKRGGSRPGAGRKASPTGAKIKAGFSLSPDVHAFVTALPANTRSAFVEAAIRAQMPDGNAIKRMLAAVSHERVRSQGNAGDIMVDALKMANAAPFATVADYLKQNTKK